MSKGPDLSAFPIPRKGAARPLLSQAMADAAAAQERGGETAGEPPAPPPAASGQTVATTVKLDENRYLRLAEAGKPGPGRLKRRTIQDMVIEALDEWFERRGL